MNMLAYRVRSRLCSAMAAVNTAANGPAMVVAMTDAAVTAPAIIPQFTMRQARSSCP
jgi:hypothetical protein